MANLLLSAQAAIARVCLIKLPVGSSAPPSKNNKHGATQSNFLLILRKHFAHATLIGIEQLPGERVVDFAFSCTDEVGTPSVKILTVEIMGRHSNLILWDKESNQILCASHIVTEEMSRLREIAPGLMYSRPPEQERANIFQLSKEEFEKLLQSSEKVQQEDEGITPQQWLFHTIAGIGRQLAEEIVLASSIDNMKQLIDNPDAKNKLWSKLDELKTITQFEPTMKSDLSRYSVISWLSDMKNEPDWKSFLTVNDMIEEYYRAVEAQEKFKQLKERLRTELQSESQKLDQRLQQASQFTNSIDLTELKKFGDLILAHIHEIKPGQSELICEDLYEGNQKQITIALNPNLSPSQNAQHFYAQFAKKRTKRSAASVASTEARARIEVLQDRLGQVEKAADIKELNPLREVVLSHKLREGNKASDPQRKKLARKIMTVTSSDGLTIYAGRNREENDEILSTVAQPNDMWFHILGQGGAHVVVRTGSKQTLPATTLNEAAQIAARLSKAAPGSKVRVAYTQFRYVKKIGKDQPGLARYENEKTIEVDTSAPLPESIQQSLRSR
jgi:predicted ribosome quality control (RQC) complex YloA/Tae2 family protein